LQKLIEYVSSRNIGNQIEVFLFMLVLIITIYPTVKTDPSKTKSQVEGKI
jgi:hypothetical protein